MTFRVKQLSNNEFEISFVPQVPSRLPVSEPVEYELNHSPKAAMIAEKSAAAMLRELLTSGEKTSSECREFLSAAGLPVDAMNFGRVRRKAGASLQQRGGKCWWLLEPQPETRAAVAAF